MRSDVFSILRLIEIVYSIIVYSVMRHAKKKNNKHAAMLA